MRKKLHSILYLILIGLVCFVSSCAPSAEEKESNKVLADSTQAASGNNSDFENVFESDTLTAEQLAVFQHRAQQKLQDFINYVEIISNKSYNAEMREIAEQQINELFADSTVMINIQIIKNQKVPCTISEYLNDINLSDYDSLKVKTDSIVLSQPKKSNELMNYNGVITSKVTIDGFKNGTSIFSTNAIHAAATIISKTKKQFGGESKMIWSVTIGALK